MAGHVRKPAGDVVYPPCPDCGTDTVEYRTPIMGVCTSCGKPMIGKGVPKQRIASPPPDLEVPVRASSISDVVVPRLHTPLDNEELMPDIVGFEVGWRVWTVDLDAARDGESVLLESVTNDFEWPAGEAVRAECEKMHDKKHKGRPAAFSCSCGFYTAKTRAHLLTMPYPQYDIDDGYVKVLGQVRLWGRVVQGTQGWRSEFCYPHKLFVPYEAWPVVKPLREAYKVEVKLDRTIKQDEI